MPPSGGGLVHPHQQYFATPSPGNQFLDELKNVFRGLYKANGSNYWSELIEVEHKQEKGLSVRLGRLIGFLLLSPWVCLARYCASPDVFDVTRFTREHVKDLVAILLKIFKYYISTDIYSFNASLFFGPEGQRSFACHFRIAARTFLNMRLCAGFEFLFRPFLGACESVIRPRALYSLEGIFSDILRAIRALIKIPGPNRCVFTDWAINITFMQYLIGEGIVANVLIQIVESLGRKSCQ